MRISLFYSGEVDAMAEQRAKRLDRRKNRQRPSRFNLHNDIIVKITSQGTLKTLWRLKIHCHVLGGIVLRPTQRVVSLMGYKPRLGDTLILIGPSNFLKSKLEQGSKRENWFVNNHKIDGSQ